MSIVEIIIYSVLGVAVLGLLFKWFIYDLLIKPKKAAKSKKIKITEEEEE